MEARQGFLCALLVFAVFAFRVDRWVCSSRVGGWDTDVAFTRARMWAGQAEKAGCRAYLRPDDGGMVGYGHSQAGSIT
jgi:hypothetical protein